MTNAAVGTFDEEPEFVMNAYCYMVNQAKSRNAIKLGNFVIFHAILVFKITIESVLPTFLLVTLILNTFRKHNIPCNIIFKK